MINLRYHIVSLTAVFLAMGIGLTLGSTFLDRATVDNLNGQLENLETRLRDRDRALDDIEGQLEERTLAASLFDEQGIGLLGGRLVEVPVVVLTARGVDTDEVDHAVDALVTAGATVDGVWWLTERVKLSAESDQADLAAILGETSTDPARLRRTLVGDLGGGLRTVRAAAGAPGEDEVVGPTTTTEPAPATTTSTTAPPAPEQDVAPAFDEDTQAVIAEVQVLLGGLVSSGFVDFQPVPGGSEVPVFVPGTRLVIVGGSPDVPDDLVLVPLLERLTRASDLPFFGVVASASPEGGSVADVVAVVREDEVLRTLASTVDDLGHLHDWAALVLGLADVPRGSVGHYGLAEGAARLLPALGPV